MLGQCLDKRRMTVTERIDRDTGKEVEVLPSAGVIEVAALAANGFDILHAREGAHQMRGHELRLRSTARQPR